MEIRNMDRIPRVMMYEGNSEEKIGTVMDMVRGEYAQLLYHNVNHGFDVWNAARNYGMISGVDSDSLFSLETAALLHDKIVVLGRTDNEVRTKEFCDLYLPTLGYTDSQVEKNGDLILATRMPQEPVTYLEKLICDADLDNLGRPDFFEKGELLRQELGVPYGVGWLETQLSFIEGHEYHTDIAKYFRNDGKARNVETLKKMIRDYGE